MQESVRDWLEYGKYRPGGGMSMTQYLERQILQCRQLIPPISDHHLIRKLARHYTRDIEVAIMTRGIREIPQFEALLQEYASINNGYERNSYDRIRNNNNENKAYGQGFVKRESNIPTKQEEKVIAEKRNPAHKGNYMGKAPTRHPINVNTIVIEPSTSRVAKNGKVCTETRPEQ